MYLKTILIFYLSSYCYCDSATNTSLDIPNNETVVEIPTPELINTSNGTETNSSSEAETNSSNATIPDTPGNETTTPSTWPPIVPTTITTTTITDSPNTTDTSTSEATTQSSISSSSSTETLSTSTASTPVVHDRHFDGGSFVGGIIFVTLLGGLAFGGWMYYKKRILAHRYANF